MLYDETLLAATFHRNLILETPIKIVSVTQAFVSHGIANPRFQFHLILEFHDDPIANYGFPASSTSINFNDGTKLGQLLTFVQRLPVELKNEVIKPNIDVCDLICTCDTIYCSYTPHTRMCEKRQTILSDRVDILYPISFRTTHNSYQQPIRQVYAIYTTTLDGHAWFGNCDIPGRGFLIGNQAKSDLKILDRLHFQGNTLNLNDRTFKRLRITDDDNPTAFPKTEGTLHFSDNVYFRPDNLFSDIHTSCSHAQEFIPEMTNIERHYLLFD